MEVVFPGNKKAKAKPGEALKAVAAKAKYSPNYGCGQCGRARRGWRKHVVGADHSKQTDIVTASYRDRGGQVRLLRAQGLRREEVPRVRRQGKCPCNNR